jgi:hypothetical protein
MSSPIPVVKPAIYTLLRNSTGLIAISHDSSNKALVYPQGGVSSGLAPPYTVMRSLEITKALEASSFGDNGPKMAWELLLTLDTWSLYDGGQQIEAMHSAIYDTLDGKEADIQVLLTGLTCTYCLFQPPNAQKEDNSTGIKLLHGIESYAMRVRVI